MSDLSLEALLHPVSDSAPCGGNLEYCDAFRELEQAAQGKPEQEYGDTLVAAEPPDWRRVDGLAQELFKDTRDLRVAVHWLRARTRLHGVPAFAQGLRLLQELLTRHWDHVHPQLDTEDHDDPTMRLNALAPLVDPLAVMADLRAAHLGDSRIGLTVRQLELALGKAQRQGTETAPTQKGAIEALRQAATEPGLLEAMQHANEAVRHIDAEITERVGAKGPEFKPLLALTQVLVDAAALAVAGGEIKEITPGPETRATPLPVDGTSSTHKAEGPHSRDDVVRLLSRACDWIEHHEPCNPAPMLIRRAQRLMSKNFMEIIRDLVPDGIDQVTRIAGSAEER